MQQYADIYLLLNYSTCFGRPSHPSSGVQKALVAVSGTGHTIWGASFLKRDRESQYIYLNINQLDELNFIMSLFHSSTRFEHYVLIIRRSNCTVQPLVSSH